MGYTISHERKGRATYRRRMFYLHAGDPWPFVGAPSESVDPLTLGPGERGTRTKRSVDFDPVVVVERLDL